MSKKTQYQIVELDLEAAVWLSASLNKLMDIRICGDKEFDLPSDDLYRKEARSMLESTGSNYVYDEEGMPLFVVKGKFVI